MRKILMFVLVFLFIGSYVLAEDFQPVTLNLSVANPNISYQGGALSFNVTVTGTPANVLFLVFTKDKGGEISAVRNGYLGWHYVNGIDTCLLSALLTLEPV